MAKENVHEMKAQDNGQAVKDMNESLRSTARGVSEELRQWAAKAELLANVNFEELTDTGGCGIVYLLRELSDGIFDLGEKLWDSCDDTRENGLTPAA